MRTSTLNPLICVVLVLAGCAGAPIQQSPAVSPTSPPVPTAGTSGQPTPPRTAAPQETPDQSEEPDLHLGGTITWSTEATLILDRSPELPNWESRVTLTGTMQVVLLVHDSGYDYELSAERDGGSTYTYDYSIHETDGKQCDTHETGTLETWAGDPGGFNGDWSLGQLNVLGGLFDDLDLGIGIVDWCGAQMGMDVPEELQHDNFIGFPACPEDSGSLTAEFDGSASYVIDCSYEYDESAPDNRGFGNGQVSGTLQMLDGPHPTPR